MMLKGRHIAVAVLACARDVLCEFYAAVTGKDKMPSNEAEAQIDDWLQLFPVVTATSKSLIKAITAATSHTISFWGAMLWAVAREAG